jgi:hypothetical protein
MSGAVHKCPCCGAVLPKAVPLNAVPGLAHLNAQQEAVFCLLAVHPGAWVRTKRVIDAVWADDVEGGPLRPGHVLKVICAQMRPKLAAFGVNIINGWPEGRPGWMRLVFVEPVA